MLLVDLLIIWKRLHVSRSLDILIILHAVVRTCTFFFSRFLLSRNYKSQVIAHVGRKSVVELSGIVEASYSHFFIGIDFDCALLENVRLGKCILIRLQSPREWKNRTRLDEYYFFYYLIPPEDIIWKKNSGHMN